MKEYLAGHEPDLEQLARKTINLLDSCSILNALEQMRKASTHIAFVVNEFGDFVGVLTMTDILSRSPVSCPTPVKSKARILSKSRVGSWSMAR